MKKRECGETNENPRNISEVLTVAQIFGQTTGKKTHCFHIKKEKETGALNIYLFISRSRRPYFLT
jgi:hypothetical protein